MDDGGLRAPVRHALPLAHRSGRSDRGPDRTQQGGLAVTIVVVCPDCNNQNGEYRNGSEEIFEARLKCEDGCPEPLPDDPEADDAMAHLAQIREED